MRALASLLFVSLAIVSACSSSDDDDAAAASTGAGGAAPSQPEAPQVVSDGGAVLASPKVVAIVYDADPVADDVDAFVNELAASAYWPAVTSEYGVGPITPLPTIRITGAIPTTQGVPDFLQLLDQNTKDASSPWGKADTNTIYAYVIPESVAFDVDGSPCCGMFAGYHDEAIVEGGVKIPYAVICQCDASMGGPPITTLQGTTTTLSHEIIEASTDPYVEEKKIAFGQADQDHAAFTVVTSGEVSDMCEFGLDQFYAPPDMHYTVQRSWSNAAAKAGHNPCVPFVSATPYFNAEPVLDDDVTINVFGVPTLTKGVSIPLTTSRSIEVDLFSDAPISKSWKVQAYDASVFLGGDQHLDVSLDKTTGTAGDKLTLTINVLSQDPTIGGEIFALESTDGTEDNLWFGAVGN